MVAKIDKLNVNKKERGFPAPYIYSCALSVSITSYLCSSEQFRAGFL